jgi:ABC-2 type transport system ATP-binding protein
MVNRSAAPVLVVEGVTRVFGDKVVLDGIDMSVDAGEIHAVLGPNGAGKTTLLRIIAGIADPTGGTVTVSGVSKRPGDDRDLRRIIGLVPASAQSFYMRLSGFENLLFFARLEGLSKRAAVPRAKEVLDLVGLSDASSRRAGHYSTGMQRRLTVARAMLTSPPLLLVDEATQALDPEGARAVREMFLEIAGSGTAVIWTTQRIDEIRAFADRVSFLHGGRFRFTGTVPELAALARPRHYVVELESNGLSDDTLLPTAAGAVVGLAELRPVTGAATALFMMTLGTDVMLGSALDALSTNGFGVISCTEERSPIEEAFLALSRDD